MVLQLIFKIAKGQVILWTLGDKSTLFNKLDLDTRLTNINTDLHSVFKCLN